MLERRDKIEINYLDLAEIVGQRGTCAASTLWRSYCEK